MKTRAQLPDVLSALRLTNNAVEVGTYRGDFAVHWLEHWPGNLICVDAWRFNPQCRDILNHPQPTLEQVYVGYMERMAPYAHRHQTMRMLSVDAARVLRDAEAQFDCIYLDAGHDYDNIHADIEAWWPLVKPGGMFAGHDYLNATVADGYPADFGVKQAVDEFVAREKLVLSVTDEPFPTWWVFKEDR